MRLDLGRVERFERAAAETSFVNMSSACLLRRNARMASAFLFRASVPRFWTWLSTMTFRSSVTNTGTRSGWQTITPSWT